MYTVWMIGYDGDAEIQENIKSKAAALKKARSARDSDRYDFVYIEVGNGEDQITDF